MVLLILLIAPTLFWAAYHYYKDRYQPEPTLNLLLSYGFGIAAGFISMHTYGALEWIGLRYDAYELAQTNKMGLFFYAILIIGMIEEIIKFIPFWLIGKYFYHFDEPIDGIIYASFIALGFATHENIYYLSVLQGYEAMGRAIASPLVHIMFASIWGYAYGWAKIGNHPLLPATVIGLILAALAHGLYNFVVIGFLHWIYIVSPLIILIIWLWRLYLIEKLHQPYKGCFQEKNVPIKKSGFYN
jgi:RsiW-degrading membrane proteinase PrsW (M82 family)